MLAWGDKWLDDGAGAPVVLHHHEPDHKIVPRVVCTECGEPVVHSDIQFCVGPGYPDDVRPELDMRERLAPTPAPSVIGARRAAKPSGKATAKRARDARAPGSTGTGRDGGTRNADGASTVKRARPAHRKRSAG
jgi:hypothetical protein